MSFTRSTSISKLQKTKWSNYDIIKFLETYKNYKLLWDIRHPLYGNKRKREISMEKLRQELIMQDLIVPDLEFLRAKIKNIKSTYRQECIKVETSKSTEDIYQPKLPWYDMADEFLGDSGITKKSTSKSKVPQTEEDDLSESDEQLEFPSPEAHESTTPKAIPSQSQSSRKKRRINSPAKPELATPKVLMVSENRPSINTYQSQSLDEFDSFAQHIAAQMRQLPIQSVVLLQEKIQSLITHERLKHISNQSSYMETIAVLSGGRLANGTEDNMAVNYLVTSE